MRHVDAHNVWCKVYAVGLFWIKGERSALREVCYIFQWVDKS
jgi:hypothetical protein